MLPDAALIEAFGSARGSAAERHLLHQIEDRLSPQELAAALPELDLLPVRKRELVNGSSIVQLLRVEAPQPYVRREIASGVEFFSSGTARGEKDLIVAFRCRPLRLMMPPSVFLQMLPADRFDVVLLGDATRQHFFNGIEGYADSLPGVCMRLLEEFDTGAYRRVFTYGASMGGFAALRAGPLLKAYRAISVGGSFPWQINRLQKQDRPVLAFDPLCACMKPSDTEFVCVYGAGDGPDAREVEALKRIMPITDRPMAGINEHNVIFRLFLESRLRAFYADMFEFEPVVAPAFSFRPPRLPLLQRLRLFVRDQVLAPVGLWRLGGRKSQRPDWRGAGK